MININRIFSNGNGQINGFCKTRSRVNSEDKMVTNVSKL